MGWVGGAGWRWQRVAGGLRQSRQAAVGSTARWLVWLLTCSAVCPAAAVLRRGAGGGVVPGSGHAVQAVPNCHERADTGPNRGGC